MFLASREILQITFLVLEEKPITYFAFTENSIHSAMRANPEHRFLGPGLLSTVDFWTTFLGGLYEHVLTINDKAQPPGLVWHSQKHIKGCTHLIHMQLLDDALKWVDSGMKTCSKPHRSMSGPMVH